MIAKIMAIGNVTPDSFYAGSRLMPSDEKVDTDRIVMWARQAIVDGAEILDIGACSTRPNSTPVDEETEWRRLAPALEAIREALPEAQLSVDTFRPEIARRVLGTFGPLIINDISGGCEAMYSLVRTYAAPYIWTLRGDLDLPSRAEYMEGIDLILDPGFGFIGSPELDYACMRSMDSLRRYNLPILVGVSRKSMVYKPLGLTPETCLEATQALQLYTLFHGATILRTHDVAHTARTITLYNILNNSK